MCILRIYVLSDKGGMYYITVVSAVNRFFLGWGAIGFFDWLSIHYNYIRRFIMKKLSSLLLSATLVASIIPVTSASASDSDQYTSTSTPVSAGHSTTLQSSTSQASVNYHSIRFSIDFMDTIMAGDSEPRGQFYRAVEEAIGAPVIFYDFWSDHIIIKVMDKQLSPEEAEVVKNKLNSLKWINETYGIPLDQDIITDIHWFDRWS